MQAITSGQQDSRMFDQAEMEAYAQQSDFDYMNYTIRPPSVWERLSWWFQSMLERLFLNPNTPWMTRIAYYLLLLIVLGLAIFYIIRLRYGGGVAPDYQTISKGNIGIEQSKSEDFDRLIHEAISEKNFKLAIRYVYLKSLIALAKRELIQLRDWKSPYDYSRELKGETADSYREIAQLFEYVWYGDFEAKEEDFSKGEVLCHKLASTV